MLDNAASWTYSSLKEEVRDTIKFTLNANALTRVARTDKPNLVLHNECGKLLKEHLFVGSQACSEVGKKGVPAAEGWDTQITGQQHCLLLNRNLRWKNSIHFTRRIHSRLSSDKHDPKWPKFKAISEGCGSTIKKVWAYSDLHVCMTMVILQIKNRKLSLNILSLRDSNVFRKKQEKKVFPLAPLAHFSKKSLTCPKLVNQNTDNVS